MQLKTVKTEHKWVKYSQGYPIVGRKVQFETIVGFFQEKAKLPKETKVHEEMRLRWKYID